MDISGSVEARLSDVGKSLLPRCDEIAAVGCLRVANELPRIGRAVPADDLQQSGRAVVSAILKGLAGQDRDPVQVDAAFDTGRRRQTQGVALEDMLRAVRIHLGALWGALVEAAGDASGSGEIRCLAMLRAWDYVENAMGALTDGYRYEETLVDRDLLVRRARALAALAFTPEPDAHLVSTVSEVLGFGSEGTYLVAAARLSTGSDYRLEMRWKSLTTPAYVGLVGEDIVGVTVWSRLARRVLDELVAESPGHLAVVGPPAQGVANLHRAITTTRIALRGASAGQVTQSGALVIESLLAVGGPVTEALPEAVLGRLLALPDQERERLLTTVDGWLRTDGGTSDIASSLNRHRNTVINHLRRVSELTGLSLTTPVDIATLVAAVRAVQLETRNR